MEDYVLYLHAFFCFTFIILFYFHALFRFVYTPFLVCEYVVHPQGVRMLMMPGTLGFGTRKEMTPL
jgi:hypothetical protein